MPTANKSEITLILDNKILLINCPEDTVVIVKSWLNGYNCYHTRDYRMPGSNTGEADFMVDLKPYMPQSVIKPAIEALATLIRQYDRRIPDVHTSVVHDETSVMLPGIHLEPTIEQILDHIIHGPAEDNWFVTSDELMPV